MQRRHTGNTGSNGHPTGAVRLPEQTQDVGLPHRRQLHPRHEEEPVERIRLDFQQFAGDLVDGLSSDGPADSERSVLVEEVKIGCTLGMLQCLDRPHRLAYILGEILDLPGSECTEALDISPEPFRKRRTTIEAFTRTHCGLASDDAACACHRRVPAAVRLGRVRPDALDFAEQPSSFQETRALIRRAEQARWALQVHRTSRTRASAVDFARRLARSLDSPRDPSSS